MAQGRGNSAFSVLILLFCMLLHSCDMAYAETYTVGDKNGWSFFVAFWADGKTFKAGDVLVFNYNPLTHNLVAVDEYGFKSCSAGSGKEYRTGHDSITLPKGKSYFICSMPYHCVAKMKLEVNAL